LLTGEIGSLPVLCGTIFREVVSKQRDRMLERQVANDSSIRETERLQTLRASGAAHRMREYSEGVLNHVQEIH
jgi:hypothetical protein